MLYKYTKNPNISFKYNIRDSQLNRNKGGMMIINILASTLFIFGLITMIFSLYPYGQIYLNVTNDENKISKAILTASSSHNVLGLQSIYNFNEVYSANLTQNLNITNQVLKLDPKIHPELENITGEMKLSLPKLNIKNLPVAINVNSYDSKVYLPILESKLAHFKGTSLPNHPGNSFIYGHSANEIWARINPNAPTTAFTFLNKLDIGDEITIEYDGQIYSYIVERAKIVPPDDISPIYTFNDNIKTVTLMTCWPPGVGTDRLIVIAKQT
jgi:LPXTG-site transpeptidase (sortase) family protein